MKANVIKVIEDMGFKKFVDEYAADFYEPNSGSFLTFVVKEESDEDGIPRIMFYAYNTRLEFLGKYSLDQMMDEVETGLIFVPRKTDKQYLTTISVKFDIPVDMTEVDAKTYLEWVKANIQLSVGSSEMAAASKVARADLREFLQDCPFNYCDIEIEKIKELE